MIVYSLQPAPYWVHLIWIPILLVGVAGATVVGWRLKWAKWSNARGVAPVMRPLRTQDILDIYRPGGGWVMHRQLPNVDNLMHRKTDPPTVKLPHIPTVCKTCTVSDVKMLASGVCLQCGTELKLAEPLTVDELKELLAWCQVQAEEFRSKRNLPYQFRWDRTIGLVEAKIHFQWRTEDAIAEAEKLLAEVDELLSSHG